MTNPDLARFCSEYLPQNPELKASMDGITDHRQFARAMVGAAGKAGFVFTEDDILDVLKTQELTEDQLDAVSGGTKAKDPPKSKTEYLVFTLKTIYVSG